MSTTAVTSSVPAAESITLPDNPSYRKTGMLEEPVKAAPAPQKEPSASAPPEGEPADETAAAPEAAPRQDKNRRKIPAEGRIRQLLEDNRKLQAQLEEARRPKDAKTAEPSPAAAQPKADEAPKKPNRTDFKTWDEYEDARDKYYEDLATYNRRQAVLEAERNIAQRERLATLQQKLVEARGKYADFDTKAGPLINELISAPDINQAVKQRLGNSPVLSDLLYVVAGDDAKRAEFLQTMKRDPVAAIGEIAVLEYLIREELSSSGPKPVPAKKATSAPPPTTEAASGRGTTPPDDVSQAFEASKDTVALSPEYRAAANRRDIQRRKGR